MNLKFKNWAEAYKHILYSLMNKPEYVCSPRGYAIKEITNFHFEIEDSTSNLFKNEIRSPNMKYLYGELYWYFTSRNDLAFIQKFSKFWDKIANEDDTLNSAYGYLIFQKAWTGQEYSEWEWAYKSLIQDKDSRQSIIRFNKPEHSFEGNKDFVCTLNGQFLIRNNKLNLHINMRSSDVYFGLPYDVPFFSLLQQQMLITLTEKYPDLTLGKLSLNLGSVHIYERNFITINEMLKYDFIEDKVPELQYSIIHPDGYNSTIFNAYQKEKTGDVLPYDVFLNELFKYIKEIEC